MTAAHLAGAALIFAGTAVVALTVARQIGEHNNRRRRNLFTGAAMRYDHDRRTWENNPDCPAYEHRYAAAGIDALEDWLRERAR